MKNTLSLVALFATGCIVGNDSDAPLPYDQFKERYIGGQGGTRFYDWDQPLRGEDQIESLYAAYVAAKTDGETVSEATVGRTLYGAIDIWSPADRANLTYCVSDAFGAYKGAVVAAMSGAASAWASASNGKVKYVHATQYDATCSTASPVVFDVTPVNDPQGAYATAFFPSFPRTQRQVLINTALAFNGDFPLEGILRHELGHTLGLRHETARIEGIISYGIQCFEDIFFKTLTTFDDRSVMTTPACMGNAIKNTTLTLSSLDVVGIQKLYP